MTRVPRSALIALVAILCSSCGSCQKPPAPAGATTAPPAAGATAQPSPVAALESVNQQLRRQLQARPDPLLAAQLFSIEVTPLPGVSIPAGRRESPMSGTYAATQLLAAFDKLTDAQRKAAAPFLGLAPFSDAQKNLPAFNPPPFKLPGARADAVWIGRSAPVLLGAGFVPVLAPPAPSQEEQLRAIFLPIFNWANGAIAQLIGRSTPLPDKFDIEFFSDPGEAFALTSDFAIQCLAAWHLNCREDDPNKPGQKMGGAYYDLGRRLDNCHTSLNMAKFSGLTIETVQSIVTHEVFHCYQDHAIANLVQLQSVGDWLIDGEATWVQSALIPSAVFPRMNDIWREYFYSPKTHLFDRGYPALGFFGHLSDVGGNGYVATNLLDAFVRGVDRNNDDAYSVLTSQQEDRFLDTWAASYFLAHHEKFLWDARGPGDKSNIPGSGPSPETIHVGTGSNATLPPVAKWELGLVRLDSSADIVEVTMDAGHLSLIDSTENANVQFADGEPIRFCNIDKCTCPADSDGEVPPTRPGRAPYDIGMTAGRQRAAAHARGYNLTEYCKKRESDPPGTGGGGGGGGATADTGTGWDPPPSWEPPHGKASSDPHIATIDGRWFDLQAIGEFVLSRSTVDDFQVQVRFGTRSNDRVWSTPVAMATHAGKDRIVISLNLAAAEPIPVLRVNGKVADPNHVELDGAVVREIATQWGPGYAITFRDGTRVGANLTGRDGLSTWVNPSAARRGKLTGLLGNADGDKSNDPIVRDGAVLVEVPSFDELYQAFGNSWRIRQADSLFDYGNGESTATMSDATYPDRNQPAAAPAAVAAANQLCGEGGITDADLLRNCAFDVAATGKRRYISSYQSDQRRVTYSLMLKGNGMVTRQASAGTTRDVVLEGKVTDAAKPVALKFSGGKGDIIYIDPRNCVDFRFSDLRGPDGKELKSNNMAATAGLCGSRYALPSDGTYQLTANIFSDRTGDYRYPIVGVRPDRVKNIAIGETMQGTISQRAERDVYVLTVRGKTTISLDAEGCVGNFDVALMFGDDQNIGAGSQCRFGVTELPKAGSYRFVFNPFNNTTGDYKVRLKQE